MRAWDARRVAGAAGARLVADGRDAAGGGPTGAAVDSQRVEPGQLFVGVPGARTDGGRFAAQALVAGAWGVLVRPEHASGLDGAVLTAADPLAALRRLAVAWRAALGAQIIAITGSTGKTSTKDLLAGMLAPHRRTVATLGNLNTEFGVPMTLLGAPAGTEVVIVEMAMRGRHQIALLTEIAAPQVGLITNVGPAHVELLGSVENIAAAKAELLAGMAPGGTAVVPVGDTLLAPHLRADLRTVSFGPGGDVDEADLAGLELPFASAHMRRNAQAALAAARAVGVEPSGRVEVALSALRGQRTTVGDGVTVVDDCYNANPMSVHAALDDLAATAPARRVAVLGDMRELGADAPRHHVEAGAHARAQGVALLITVGGLAEGMGGDRHVATAAEAAELVPTLLEPHDTVLVKGSRGVGLEVVGRRLRGEA